MSKFLREQLFTLLLLAALIIMFLLAWQFVLRPSEDREPSRSRMVWHSNLEHNSFSAYPLAFK